MQLHQKKLAAAAATLDTRTKARAARRKPERHSVNIENGLLVVRKADGTVVPARAVEAHPIDQQSATPTTS